jgi:uncharacterized glyoxalase superfamily protein PhnB
MDDDKIISLFGEDREVKMDATSRKRILDLAAVEYSVIKTRRRPAEYSPHHAIVHRPSPLRAVFLTALVFCLFLGVAWQRGSIQFGPAPQVQREKLLLAEFNELFGGRVQAVISAGGKTQIVLSEAGAPAPRGQPVVIRFNDKGRDVEVMSFSGQTVQVNLDGRDVVFDTLVSGEGRVILAGEKVFWDGSKGEVTDAPAVKIRTEVLEM